MKKFSKTPEETKTSKTTETADKNEKKITEDDLDSVELGAIHRLAFHMAMRRRLKEMIEGERGKEPPRGILSDLEKDSDSKPRRTMHSALDETGNLWDGLFGKHHSDDEDEDELPFGGPDDDDEDEDDEESETNEFLREHYIPNNHGKYVTRPRAKCADGYSVSIQAGSDSDIRCWPNEDTDEFTHVALDFPSCVDEELLPYRYDLEDDDEIFYFFVPVEVVDKVLEKHGGIVGTESKAEFFAKKIFGI